MVRKLLSPDRGPKRRSEMRIDCAMRIATWSIVVGCSACSGAMDGAPAMPGTGGSGASCQTTVQAAPGIVLTDKGPVAGTAATTAYSYLGIPYAAPPIGPLRWRPPVEPACHAELLDASALGNICPQLNATGAVVGEEDCLTINVWAPTTAPAKPLPVLVWIHGGGNHSASSGVSTFAGGFTYDGTPFVERGLVFVSFNFRIGALGFLAHPALDAENADHVSGNYALLDQIQALQWIQKNIKAFGGDPAAVTVMGSSAGATDMLALMAAPRANGL